MNRLWGRIASCGGTGSRLRSGAFLAAAAFTLAACSSPKSETPKSEAPVPAAEAPDQYRVRFDTTKGPFTIEVHKDWAPKGAARFHRLIRDRYYDGARFYRVRPGFVVQWGISAEPETNRLWKQLKLTDDPVKQSNDRGYVSFATDGPDTRTTEVFINLANNKRLDARGFSPFGRVVEGMEVVDQLFAGYGEVQALRGTGVDSVQYEREGETYIGRSYPKLDQIRSARIIE